MSTRSIVVVGPLAGLLLVSRAAALLHRMAWSAARALRRVQAGAAAAARRRMEVAARPCPDHVPEDWESAARRRYASRASDPADLERRLRAFDREEPTAWRAAGWP